MRVVWCTATTALVVVAGVAQPAGAQALTLSEAIARARARAPEVVAATASIDEARARLLGASARFRENPRVTFDVGPRRSTGIQRGSGPQTWDYSTSVGQVLETGGQRRARIDSAEAEVAAARATADETARVIARDVAFAYIRAAAATERLRLLGAAETVAEQLRTATARRYQVGDVAALDSNLTVIAAARARADRLRAEAEREDALKPLRRVLGLDARSEITLADGVDRQPAAESVLLAAVAQAPVIQRIDAELTRTRADVRLGSAMRRPDLEPRVSYSREQDDHIVLGGLTVALPLFQRGQALTAEADARIRRLNGERAAVLSALTSEVTAGLAVYARKRTAADTLRDSALPAAADNESLASRSLEAGEVGLLDLLLVRQDVTATRLAWVDAAMDAALAAIEIDAIAGVLR